MQRTVSLNSREYELVLTGLSHSVEKLNTFEDMAIHTSDERKMLYEEYEKLITRLKEQADTPSGGTYIDGVRV